MAGQFRVEPAGLGRAADRLGALAADLAGTDLAGPLQQAASAAAGAGAAAQAARLTGELAAGLDALTEAVRAMSAACAATAGNYTAADSSSAAQFQGLLGGGTTAGAR